jgi:uncharacterized protein (DUF885 family)
MIKKYLLLLPVLLFACQSTKTVTTTASTTATSANETELNKIFKSIAKSTTTSEDSLYRGFHPRGQWSFESAEDRKNETDKLRNFVAQLEAIDSKSLTTQEKISRDVMLISLKDRIDHVAFKMYYIPFNAEGGFYNRLSYVLPRLPFKTVENYSDYLNWLPNYATSLQDNVSMIRTGMRDGIVAPKAIVKNTLDLLKPFVTEDYRQSPFYGPLKNISASISATEKVAIEKEAEVVIGNLTSTYKSLYGFFSTEYMNAAKEKPGISEIPGGKAYYENRVLHYTTLQLTPDSVHALGLQEVARIRETMEKIIEGVKFKGGFSDFLNFMRNDSQFYAQSPQELLNAASWLSKKAEGQLPKYFRKLYSLPFTVEPVPDDIAPTYTSGRYVPGSWENKKPGIYWVNIYDLKSRPLYNLPALTVHEAVPGHHLQNMIAAEIKDIPAFRNRYYISAFGEGWGLYCEYLGEEMGMYSTPYELFGRSTYEMWRACRLVVDTGIHYKGWTRDDAIKYLAENTALSIHEVTTEIDRYIGWPGQALSYKIGELKIKSLRKKSEAALKEKFDVREFHEVVLENGSVPLPILESQVDAYIERARARK